jgi:hypothetical protein
MPRDYPEGVTPEAWNEYCDKLRQMTGEERLGLMFQLIEYNHELRRTSMRWAYPDASDREIFLRAAATRLDRDDMIKVYGWDPDLHP